MHSTDGAFVSVYAVTCDTMWGVSERAQGECRRDLVNRNQWWDKHRAEDHEMVKFILYISRVLHVNKNHLLSSCKSRWCFILFFFFFVSAVCEPVKVFLPSSALRISKFSKDSIQIWNVDLKRLQSYFRNTTNKLNQCSELLLHRYLQSSTRTSLWDHIPFVTFCSQL